MKRIICSPGSWELWHHTQTAVTCIFKVLFPKTTYVALTFNKGWITIFLVKNHSFVKIFKEYGFEPKNLSFTRTR